jgi:hypothetical protein
MLHIRWLLKNVNWVYEFWTWVIELPHEISGCGGKCHNKKNSSLDERKVLDVMSMQVNVATLKKQIVYGW